MAVVALYKSIKTIISTCNISQDISFLYFLAYNSIVTASGRYFNITMYIDIDAVDLTV